MHPSLRFLCLVGALSTFMVRETKSSVLDFPPGSENATTLKSTKYENLTYPPIPWGPEDFDVDISHTGNRIPGDTIFTVVTRAVAEEALNDFDGNLPNRRIIFRYPEFPTFVIGVESTDPNQGVLRKYFYWTLARATNQLIRDRVFQSSTFTMRWQGNIVGKVLFVAARPRQKAMALLGPDWTMTSPSDSSALAFPNNTTMDSSVGVDRLTWTFEPFGDNLMKNDIAMGTLGGLIQLAEQANQDIDYFIGSFPGFQCFCIWVKLQTPSRLSKKVLIVSLVASMARALSVRDYHEMKVVVSDNGLEVGQGGWFGNPLGPGQAIASS